MGQDTRTRNGTRMGDSPQQPAATVDDEGSNDTEAGDIRNYVLGVGVDTPELVLDDDDEPDRKRVRT